jgi:toxin ParE1/3/4
MAYLVRIAARAGRDLVSLYGELSAPDSPAAQRWYAGLKRSILSLAVRPNRCPVTPEDKRLRHLLYGRKPHVYRVIYRVNERRKQVDVLHIRHGARRTFRASDLV